VVLGADGQVDPVLTQARRRRFAEAARP